VTPAAARVTWTTGGETHTADLCLRHAGDIRRLLAVVGIPTTTTAADPIAVCRRCPQQKATRRD
jgi:hypothetical protein